MVGVVVGVITCCYKWHSGMLLLRVLRLSAWIPWFLQRHSMLVLIDSQLLLVLRFLALVFSAEMKPNPSPAATAADVAAALLRTSSGVDMCIDVHGDEELPYCFIAGAEGTPSWDKRKQQLQDSFCDAFKRSSPDFQTKVGYELDAPGAANMSICTNQVGRLG